MPTVERAGRTIHFTCEGQGPGIVLVPGLGSGARLFGTLPRRFARAGFTCAAVDPVGLAPSSALPGEFDFAAAGADVLAVAATLPPPVVLVGTSLGGKVALSASAAPGATVAGLVLVCSAAVATARSRCVYRWFELLAGEVPGELLGELTAPFLFGATFHQERPAMVLDIVRSTRPTPQARAFMRLQARALQRFDGAALARQCPWPVLCLAGSEDTLTPAAEVEATASLLPRASYHALAAGHSLLLEDPAAFERIVEFARAPDRITAAWSGPRA